MLGMKRTGGGGGGRELDRCGASEEIEEFLIKIVLFWMIFTLLAWTGYQLVINVTSPLLEIINVRRIPSGFL